MAGVGGCKSVSIVHLGTGAWPRGRTVGPGDILSSGPGPRPPLLPDSHLPSSRLGAAMTLPVLGRRQHLKTPWPRVPETFRPLLSQAHSCGRNQGFLPWVPAPVLQGPPSGRGLVAFYRAAVGPGPSGTQRAAPAQGLSGDRKLWCRVDFACVPPPPAHSCLSLINTPHGSPIPTFAPRGPNCDSYLWRCGQGVILRGLPEARILVPGTS